MLPPWVEVVLGDSDPVLPPWVELSDSEFVVLGVSPPWVELCEAYAL